MNDKFSDLVIKNTKLWREWTKIYKKTRDEDLPWTERALHCFRCEEINKEIDKTIGQMNLYFDDRLNEAR